MTTSLATPVKDLIDEMILRDSGNLFRYHLGKIMPTLDDAYRESKYKFRPHMGASLQGNECARAIWYSFHWYTEPTFSARIQRLFNRGHMEEGRFMAMLAMIGCEIHQYDANGKQFTISGAAGHYGGSGDGVLRIVPGLDPSMYCLSEFKTHSDKSFKELVKKGMKVAKPEHYIQMQQYLVKMELPVGLYGAVNKNDDDLHFEYVERDMETGTRAIDRAEKIVWLQQPPERFGNPPSPGNLVCRWCDHKGVCWSKAAPAFNCRTCQFSVPTDAGGGQWVCSLYNGYVLTRDNQESGCASWKERD